MPMIITGSEDGYTRLWNSSTYKLENSTSYNMERVWSLAVMKGFNGVAVRTAALDAFLDDALLPCLLP